MSNLNLASIDTALLSIDDIRTVIKDHAVTSDGHQNLMAIFSHYSHHVLDQQSYNGGTLPKYLYCLKYDDYGNVINARFFGISPTHHHAVKLTVMDSLENEVPVAEIIISKEDQVILDELAINIIQQTILYPYTIGNLIHMNTHDKIMDVFNLLRDTIELEYPKLNGELDNLYVDVVQSTIIVLYKSGRYHDVHIDVNSMDYRDLACMTLHTVLQDCPVELH